MPYLKTYQATKLLQIIGKTPSTHHLFVSKSVLANFARNMTNPHCPFKSLKTYKKSTISTILVHFAAFLDFSCYLCKQKEW